MADESAEVTTLGSVAGLLAGTLRDCGIDPEPLFRQEGTAVPGVVLEKPVVVKRHCPLLSAPFYPLTVIEGRINPGP